MRFLNLLAQNTMTVEFDGMRIRVPHPAAFGLHKLIVSQRRKSEEKLLKDTAAALSVIDTLIQCDEAQQLKKMFQNMPSSWQKKIVDSLQNADREDIVKILR